MSPQRQNYLQLLEEAVWACSSYVWSNSFTGNAEYSLNTQGADDISCTILGQETEILSNNFICENCAGCLPSSHRNVSV
jgi:hypothetical protein